MLTSWIRRAALCVSTALHNTHLMCRICYACVLLWTVVVVNCCCVVLDHDDRCHWHVLSCRAPGLAVLCHQSESRSETITLYLDAIDIHVLWLPYWCNLWCTGYVQGDIALALWFTCEPHVTYILCCARCPRYVPNAEMTLCISGATATPDGYRTCSCLNADAVHNNATTAIQQ